MLAPRPRHGAGPGGRLAAAIVLALLLVALIPGAEGATLDADRWAMKVATNHSRVNHEVRRVSLDQEISDLARQHSVRMARLGRLVHTQDPASVYLKGKTWHYWGENVGMTGGTIAGLEDAFMDSAPHRWNILNRSYRHVAVGTVRRDGVLWVTVFFWG
jgi:uncharacterized protein YkwD